MSADDRRQIIAAEGWLELGNVIECLDELSSLATCQRTHPAVLALQWRVHAQTNNWEAAYNVTEILAVVMPNEPQPWLWRAKSIKHMTADGTAVAIELLEVAATCFPDEPLIAFTIALYTCELMRFGESHRWWKATLAIAKRQGTEKQWKIKALTDPDLQPLWHCDLSA